MKLGIKKRVGVGFVALATLVSQLIVPAQIALATPSGQPVYDVPTNGMITICHRTNSVTNPYNQINVSVEAADGISGRNENGANADHYSEHKGPVFDVSADPAVAYPTPRNGDQWGDIIPPVIPGSTQAVANTAGLNWSTEGKAIYYNGCNVPVVARDASASLKIVDPTCDTSSIVSVGSSVNASLNGSLDQSVGTHTATFTAANGHLFANGTASLSVEYTILAKLTGAQCETPKTTVTPGVVVVDKCGVDDDSVSGELIAGITYETQINGLTYTVTASPLNNGYKLAAGNGFTLNVDGTATFTKTLTSEDCEVELTEIPLPSGIGDVCGRANDIVPMPKEGDKYTVVSDTNWLQDGSDVVKTVRTITYKTNAGFVFETGEGWTLSEDKTQATYTFTDFGTKCPSGNVCTVSDKLYSSAWMYDGDTYPEADFGGTFNFEPTGLYLNTPTSDSYVFGLIDAGNTPIADVNAMSYNVMRLPQSAGFASTLPSYVLLVDTNGVSMNGGEAYFLYEPYYNDQARAAVEGSFQTWDALSSGNAKWYIVGTGQALRPWNSLATEYKDAVVLAYGFNQGQDNPSTFTAVQDIKFDCATTSFTNSSTGGSGGNNPTTPVTPVTPTVPTTVLPVGGQGSVLPAELPMTGTNGSILSTWIALLAAILTYGAVYYLQPKKRLDS